MGNLEHAPEIAGAFQVDEARRIVRLMFSNDSAALSRGAREQPARQRVCLHKLSVEQLLTNSGELFAREHVNHADAAHARFHHHKSGMFLNDFADDSGFLA
jgi:hypothetical protein